MTTQTATLTDRGDHFTNARNLLAAASHTPNQLFQIQGYDAVGLVYVGDLDEWNVKAPWADGQEFHVFHGSATDQVTSKLMAALKGEDGPEVPGLPQPWNDPGREYHFQVPRGRFVATVRVSSSNTVLTTIWDEDGDEFFSIPTQLNEHIAVNLVNGILDVQRKAEELGRFQKAREFRKVLEEGAYL